MNNLTVTGTKFSLFESSLREMSFFPWGRLFVTHFENPEYASSSDTFLFKEVEL